MAGVQPPQPYPVSITSSTRPLPQNYQQKPFAAGSAMQAETTMSPGASQRGPKVPQTVSRVESAEKASPMERPPDTGPRVKEQDPRLSPDISIVKVENELGPEETGMLDMYVSDMGRSGAGPSHGQNDEDQSDYDVEEPPGDMHRDEMSNESGNLSMDQSGNWYMGNFRGPSNSRLSRDTRFLPLTPRSRALRTMNRETYDTLLSLALGTFKTPIKQRTRVQKNAVIQFWRNKNNLSVELVHGQYMLFCNNKQIMPR
uniref:Uncharacterized protein LOC111128076 isoform X15 n=1 Tax=Crassostrea virginica TaxID=6565 RepID=A0A8B8DQL2_CRAVI|nr:uncharacterized protein LOC111128076 isoform X15 [Crassostrea virginica]